MELGVFWCIYLNICPNLDLNDRAMLDVCVQSLACYDPTFLSMLPSRRQFRKWNYPSKFGFVSFFVSLCFGFVLWLFPDGGKRLIGRLSVISQPTVSVLGRNEIERQLNIAKVEGVGINISSTEFAVAVPFVRPSLTKPEMGVEPSGAQIGLSNVSPLRSENQDLVFGPGKCRFHGKVQWSQYPSLRGQASITMIGCVLDNGDSYSLGHFNGPEIGFLTPEAQSMSKEVTLVEEDGGVTLPKSSKYLVRLHTPLRDISLLGKSNVPW